MLGFEWLCPDTSNPSHPALWMCGKCRSEPSQGMPPPYRPCAAIHCAKQGTRCTMGVWELPYVEPRRPVTGGHVAMPPQLLDCAHLAPAGQSL